MGLYEAASRAGWTMAAGMPRTQLHHALSMAPLRLSAGAGFIVVVCGEIMTMPGLPRVPASESIRLNDAGQIEGLF